MQNIKELFKLSEKVSKVTRLFAEENITVEFDSKARTASFQPENRILTFPYNLVMMGDDDIMVLLMSHEVGHAFWSTPEYLDKQNDKHCAQEGNIVEDIRIERMIKDKYPGLISTYVRGYKKLYVDGFFGDPKSHKNMSFANRLNIYAKCGPLTTKGITFDEKEEEFYKRCMLAKTEEEVLSLAIELAEWENSFSSIFLMSNEELIDSFVRTSSPVGDSIDFPEIINEELQEIGKKHPDELSQEDREKMISQLIAEQEKLDVAFEMGAKINKSTVAGVSFINYTAMPRFNGMYYTAEEMMVIAKTNLGEGDHSHSFKETQNMLSDMSKSVAYMAKEFEMKKAAARHKNAKRSNSGMIDVNRLSQYKVSDEIFANRLTVKDAKRHGMVILLDASGSISAMYNDMIKQTLLLTEYAKKIGVPFKVFVFGGYIKGGNNEFWEKHHAHNRELLDIHTWKSPISDAYVNKSPTDLLEIINSDMGNAEYIEAATNLRQTNGFSFHGTPTASAMHRLETVANDFFQQHGVTKKKIFIVTDGGPTDVSHYYCKKVVVDPETKNIYHCPDSTIYTTISIMGKIFKDRYDIDVSSIVVTNSLRNASNFISSESIEYSRIEERRAVFNSKKFLDAKDSMGLPLFFMKPNDPVVEPEFDVDENMTVAKATTQFKNAMKKMQISQTMLQAIGDQFAM